MIKLITVTLIAVVLISAGCDISSECTTYCNRVDAWSKACNVEFDRKACLDNYFVANDKKIKQDRLECWRKLALWAIQTGSDQMDCSKPPPIYERESAD